MDFKVVAFKREPMFRVARSEKGKAFDEAYVYYDESFAHVFELNATLKDVLEWAAREVMGLEQETKELPEECLGVGTKRGILTIQAVTPYKGEAK
jgi:hypothetical protein